MSNLTDDERLRLEMYERAKAEGRFDPNGSAPITERPVVRHGDVTPMLFNELASLFKRIQQADAFEAKVLAAAKSPRDWLLLRDELNPQKAVVVGEEPTP